MLLYVIDAILLFAPNEKKTCVHIANGVKIVIFKLFQIKQSVFKTIIIFF